MNRPHDIIADRHSPRAIGGEVSDAALRTMFEAARWAPSYGNTQPARYLVGRRGTPTHARIFELLARGNKAWASEAPVLVVGCAVTANDKGEVPYAEYGAGLATENLVLQAVAEGLVAHQMAGFDHDGMAREFGLPAEVRPLVVIAIGVLGEEEPRERVRLPLDELVFTEEWGKPAL